MQKRRNCRFSDRGLWRQPCRLHVLRLRCSALFLVVLNAAPESPQQLGLDQLQRKKRYLAATVLCWMRVAVARWVARLRSLCDTVGRRRCFRASLAAPVSSAVPELGVLDIPFLFRDANHAKAVTDGPVGAAIAAKFADKGICCWRSGSKGFGISQIQGGPFVRRLTSRA